MPQQFEYTALNDLGRRVTGVMEADTEAVVLRFLEEKRLVPVAVASKAQSTGGFTLIKRRVRSRDVGIMYGQLADLINSGVPMLRALDSLVRSTVNKQLVAMLKEVRAAVADGKSLTEAMRMFPETFPPLHTAMIQAGERAAFLDQVLRSLSEFLERLDELRGKVMGAMIYPALLSALGASVMIGALIFFVPKFEPLLANARKPLPTEVMFTLSTIMRSYWYLLIVLLVVVIGFAWTSMRTEKARRAMERWRLKVPVVGNAFRLLAITRFCRILGTMLSNGVPLLQALKIAKDATGSAIMADIITAAAESVRDGQRLSEPLGTSKFIPDQIMAMIGVAEESNKLDQVLLQIAETV